MTEYVSLGVSTIHHHYIWSGLNQSFYHVMSIAFIICFLFILLFRLSMRFILFVVKHVVTFIEKCYLNKVMIIIIICIICVWLHI